MYFKYIPDAKLKEELKYAINSQSYADYKH